MPQLEIKVGFAWWWKFYMLGVYAFCLTFNREPDPAKLRYWTMRAIRTKCGGRRTRADK